MQLRPEQLREHLKQGIQAIYFIYGDEPLQLRDYTDMVRNAARYYGYDEIIKYTADSQFDWQQLETSAQELSLFSSKKIIQIHLPNAKPGDKGSKALVHYAKNIPQDTILLLFCGKLESSTQRSKWFKELDKVSWRVAVYPMQEQQFKSWLQQRIYREKLQVSPIGIDFIYHHTEGNMLAAEQEVIKLGLIQNPELTELIKVSDEQIIDNINDSALYNVFDLFDTALKGQPDLLINMLLHLQADGTAIQLILSLIAKELRLLASLSNQIKSMSVQQAMQSEFIFAKRKPLIHKTLQSLTINWEQCLLKLSDIEKVSKGIDCFDANIINPWNSLKQLMLDIAVRVNQPHNI